MTKPRPASSRQRRPLVDDQIDVYGLTHPGLVRETNQDHFLISSLRKHMQVHHMQLQHMQLQHM